MPASVLMTMDGNGNGRSAGHAFKANEKATTIEHVLNAFKTLIGEEAANNIRTNVIDNDYTEVKAINNVFPNAAIHLWDFHVSRTFRVTLCQPLGHKVGEEEPHGLLIVLII